MSGPNLNFRYLNRDGQWLDLTWQGLELRADGALTLASLPSFVGSAADGGTSPDPSGPAGIAIGADGTVYHSIPDQNQVTGIGACEPFAAPRGLAIPRGRAALFVCDSGNHSVRIVDIDSSQRLEEWDGFDTPVAVAVDEAGNVYIGDSGAGQVRKFSLDGVEDPTFNVAAKVVSLAAFGENIYVLDATARTVAVFDSAGKALPALTWAGFQRPLGLAVTADSVYVGDNGLRRVLRFRNAAGYPFVGEALDYEGPVAALAIGVQGSVLVSAGDAAALAVLQAGQAFVTSGVLTSGPIHVSGGQNAWHSLHAATGDLPAGAHVRFYVRTSDDTVAQPFPSAAWSEKPLDATDLYIGGAPARYLWVAVAFTGKGTQSPVLSEIEVRFDQKTYFPYLPAIYDNPGTTREFFGRLVALFESFNVENENALALLPELFDPTAIGADYLPWLASWIAARLDQHWTVAIQRQAVAEAYQRYARRGTVAGLKQAIEFETGLNVLIEEPIQNASWWALPADPCCGVVSPPDGMDTGNAGELGVTTMLADGSPDGAVVGSTAVLDHSRILNAEDYGLPLFDEVAHRFCVYLYRGAQNAQRAKVASVVDREKPAHTVYHLCAVEPRMAVGFQARVGIDTVVGGPPAPTPLGDSTDADGFVLGPEDRFRVGVHSRIGDRLQL
jgi:phage tail-like protein